MEKDSKPKKTKVQMWLANWPLTNGETQLLLNNLVPIMQDSTFGKDAKHVYFGVKGLKEVYEKLLPEDD